MRKATFASLASLVLGATLVFSGCMQSSQADDVDDNPSTPDEGTPDGASPNGDGGGGGDDWAGSPERPPVELEFRDTNRTIAAGSTYVKDTLDGVPPFSDGIISITVINRSGGPVTIERIELNPVGGNAVIEGDASDEWVVSQPGNVDRKPFSLDNVALDIDASAEFGLHFMPYYSGERTVRVRVLTTDGREANFVLQGRGRDNLVKSPHTHSTVERVFERLKADFLIGGVVTDGSGGVVASMNANELLDGYSHDIAVVAADASGSKRWAKVWHEDFQQSSPDPGQNNESGGGAESIAYGGDHAYVVGRRSQASYNSVFQAFVFKVNASDGALSWARGITNGASAVPSIAAQSAEAYGVDASLPDRVLVTGTFGGSANDVLLVALSKSDGSILFKKRIGVTGAVERGYTVRTDAQGNGYIGGISGSTAMLLRLSGLGGSAPNLEWVRMLGIGVGGNVNSMDLADNGDVLLSLDVRGAQTAFAAARVSSAGNTVWSKIWRGDAGQRNNTHVARLHGGVAYIGGRIAVKAADTVYGDGFLLALDAATGAYKSGSMYYTGKTAERNAEHRIKGLVFSGNDVFGLTHGVTVSHNHKQYWGVWYQAPNEKLDLPAGDGSQRLDDFSFDLNTPAPGYPGLSELTDGRVHTVSVANAWRDIPSDAFYGEPRGHEGEKVQNHMLLQKLELTP